MPHALIRHILPPLLALAFCTGAAAPEPEPGYFALGDDEPVPGLAPGLGVTDLGAVTNLAEVSMRAGDELMSGLLEYVETHKPAQGRMTGIGGFESAVFAWYDPEKGLFKEIPVNMKGEVVSFTGSVSYQNGEPSVHVHALMSLDDGTVRGGHVVSAQIAPIMQVYVFETAGE